MTREQAREVLLLYRPWASTARDAETAAALAMVKTDPELREWFERHTAAQQAVRESILAQMPPEAFREEIVSEILARRRTGRKLHLLAVSAAALVVFVGIEVYVLFGSRSAKEEVSMAAYEQRMSREALRLYRMDLETNDLDQIRTFLGTKQSPSDYVLPAGVRSLEATGCLATKWQGRAVSMICFRTGKPLEPGQSSDLFLFVIANSSLPDAPQSSTPAIAQVNRLTVARWSASGNTYLLATVHGEAELRKNL